MIKQFNFLLIVTIFSSMLVTTTYGWYEKYYPPYEKDNKPRQVCKINKIISSDKSNYITGNTRIQIIAKQTSKYAQEVLINYIKNKEKVLLSNRIATEGELKNTRLYWALLNHDSKKDFIIVTTSNNDTYHLAFILSNQEGYSVINIASEAFSQDLFYDYNNDNRCEFLQMSWLGAVDIIHKKPSNKVAKLLKKSGYTGVFYNPEFFVYNIVYFGNNTARYKNKLSRYFPRWIEAKYELFEYGTTNHNLSIDQYGHMPNSLAAKITEEQKRIIWKTYQREHAFPDKALVRP